MERKGGNVLIKERCDEKECLGKILVMSPCRLPVKENKQNETYVGNKKERMWQNKALARKAEGKKRFFFMGKL